MNDLSLNLVSAIMGGPSAFRALLRSQDGLLLGMKFNGTDQSDTVMRVALRAIVFRGASLEVLNVLEETLPGLEMPWLNRNALTELVMIEHDLRVSGRGPAVLVPYPGESDQQILIPNPARVEPDEQIRTSIGATVRDVMRRMGALEAVTQMDDMLYCRDRGSRFCSSGKATLRALALENEAYYVYEALPRCSFDEFAFGSLFAREYVLPVAEDVLGRLVLAAPCGELVRGRAVLLKGQAKTLNRLGLSSEEETRKRIVSEHLKVAEERMRMCLFLCMYLPVFETSSFHLTRNFPRELFELVFKLMNECE